MRLMSHMSHQPHTHIWRGCPTEVSKPHDESFLALGFAYSLFYLLFYFPSVKTGQQLYIVSQHAYVCGGGPVYPCMLCLTHIHA